MLSHALMGCGARDLNPSLEYFFIFRKKVKSFLFLFSLLSHRFSQTFVSDGGGEDDYDSK
jgi:hypothetical protein